MVKWSSESNSDIVSMAVKSKSYKEEELLKVRPSAKVSSEMFRRISQSGAGIREHVLRDGSDGLDVARRRARSSSVITNPYEDLPAEENLIRGKPRNRSGRFSKYSPTPSIKRGKAEKLLKEHGSPPGIRVTAGGRIVPDGLSPLTSPRFDQFGPYKFPHITRLTRGYGQPNGSWNAGSFKPTEGSLVDVGNGGLCQLVAGELRPIEVKNGKIFTFLPIPDTQYSPYGIQALGNVVAPQMYQPYAPATAIPITVPSVLTPPNSAGADFSSAPTPRQIRVMEQVHAKLEQDLKDLDRNEVLQRGSLNANARAEIVRTRVELITRIDESRRGIQEAKRLLNENCEQTATVPAGNSGAGLGIYNLGQAQHPAGPISQYYNNGILQFPDYTAAFNAQQYPVSSSEYPQTVQAPVFAGTHGHFQPFQPSLIFEAPQALQERAGNVGMGAADNSINTRASTETVKEYPPNLDGSSHNPRRSHAVQIRDPNDGTAKNKTALNPTSPSYQPGEMTNGASHVHDEEHGDASTFMPSPTIVAQMDNLVQSPKEEHETINEQSIHHPSDDSATTGDFFPQNTKQHSSRNYSYSARDIHVNLPAWMPHESAISIATEAHVTPGRLPNKFIWNDSPEGNYYVNAAVANQQAGSVARDGSRQISRSGSTSISPHHPQHLCDMDFVTQSAFTHISPATKKQQSAHLRESNATTAEAAVSYPHDEKDPVSYLLERASEQAAVLRQRSSSKSEAYWEGYSIGIAQAVLGDRTDADYRLGYRDGIIQSTKQMLPADAMPSQCSQNPTPPEPASRISSASKPVDTPFPRIPAVPHNSASNSPTVQRTLKERSPIKAQSLDSPQAQADFMSQPNVNISGRLSSGRKSASHSSGLPLRSAEQTSPLANRANPPMRDTTVGKSFVMKIQGQTNNMPFDQQRFSKGMPSVAVQATHTSPTKVSFSSQVDGGTEDRKDKPLTESHPNTASPMSPRSRSRMGSPVKSAASAAVASFAYLSRSGSSKREDPTSPKSSPEKKAWRSKFKKTADMSKKPGEDEIDAYKKKFAGH